MLSSLYSLSSLLSPFWFSAKLTKEYIYKSVNILNSFIPYHQISSYLPTFTKFTKFLLYHWKLKKKCGNIEQKQLQEMKWNSPTMWTCLTEFIKSQIFFHISVQHFWFSFLLFCWCSSLQLLYSTMANFGDFFIHSFRDKTIHQISKKKKAHPTTMKPVNGYF